MSKKIFAISTLLLVLVVAFAFVYNFVFKKTSTGTGESKPAVSKSTPAGEGKIGDSKSNSRPDQKTSTSPNAKTPSVDNSAIAAVSDEPIFGAALSPDGDFLYSFLAASGQLNQTTLDGKLDKVLSTEKYSGIKKILWNRQKSKAVIKTTTSAGKTKFLIFDLEKKKVSTLKENTDSVAWSNLGDKIIYKYFDPKTKKRTVSVSDPDGKNWKDVTNTDFHYLEIASIPGSADISFWPTADANLATLASKVPFGGGEKTEILHGRTGADLLWSPDGKISAVSYINQDSEKKPDLALMSPDGVRFQSLGFPTFAGKCAWSADSKFLYCAMVGNTSESALWPNDWQSGKVKTADTFWKIEVSSGKKERLVDTERIGGSFDVLNPFLSKDEKVLFFTNKADGKLYKVKL